MARAERTRRVVVEAHIALIRAGELKPTGAQIADRAGGVAAVVVGGISTTRDLFAVTGAEVMRRQDAMIAPIDADLPLTERLGGAYCRQRAEVLEFIAPFARSSEIRAPFSRQLQRNRVWYLHGVRSEAEKLFARELAGLDDVRRREVVQALGITLTWPTWVSLRDVMRLSIPDATSVMSRMVGALLTSA